MKASTTVSLDAGILKKAKNFAKKERRSLSSQIEVWIEEKISDEAEKSKKRQEQTAA